MNQQHKFKRLEICEYGIRSIDLNHFSANFTKWSNTLKQFGGNLPTNCLSVFDHQLLSPPKIIKNHSFSDDFVEGRS